MQPFEQLEVEWAKFNDLDPAGMVACASGTAALHLALEAMELPKGSEVITGDFNMIAVPRAIAAAGLTPVFVDCNDFLNLDTNLLRNLDYDYLWSVVLTHVYGRRADVEGVHAWADENLRCRPAVVEDLAEAHGVKPHPATDAACWSFYKNKAIAGEEGGAVWFCDPEHAKLARQLRSLGFTEAHDFYHLPRGWNHRMSNAHAELILPKLSWNRKDRGLRNADVLMQQRRNIETWYDAACPDKWRMLRRDAVWVYDVRVSGLTRGKQLEVVKELNAAGIEARMSFLPMSLQEEFCNCRTVGIKNAARASNEVLYLPVQPGRSTPEECGRAFAILRAAVG